MIRAGAGVDMGGCLTFERSIGLNFLFVKYFALQSWAKETYCSFPVFRVIRMGL